MDVEESTKKTIDFTQAEPLASMYGKYLLEDYMYDCKNPDHKSIFSGILAESRFKITRVEKINNPQLHGMYLLWKEELQSSDIYSSGNAVREESLYHATSPKSAESIARNNIDWRKTTKAKFGYGAYFSSWSNYAHSYASEKGAFVMFKVLIKNVERVVFDCDFNVPSIKNCDTTLGSNGLAYAKYDDHQFYPEFIVYYTD